MNVGTILELEEPLKQMLKICAHSKDSKISDSEPHTLLFMN